MSVMISEDKKELIVTCKCGCQDTIHIEVDDKDKYADYYAIQTILSGNWYREQDDTVLRCIGRKLKKIWAIIRNKDYYYSDVLMSREDFQKYKDYINFRRKMKMDRNLDGIYFRVQRDGKWENACFSDLTQEEMEKVMENRDVDWLKSMCIQLGKTIHRIGDELDIVCE